MRRWWTALSTWRISNVPFGDYRPVDPQLAERRFLIHDYFFARSVEKVRPGGLVAFITSKGTMDKLNSSLRSYLSERADFLGAIRLPNTAFKQNANTEVTTDIVFLRRLLPGERPQGPAWLDLAKAPQRGRRRFPDQRILRGQPAHDARGHA